MLKIQLISKFESVPKRAVGSAKHRFFSAKMYFFLKFLTERVFKLSFMQKIVDLAVSRENPRFLNRNIPEIYCSKNSSNFQNRLYENVKKQANQQHLQGIETRPTISQWQISLTRLDDVTRKRLSLIPRGQDQQKDDFVIFIDYPKICC